ncbi:hypothetical protein [Deinococcus misasensis]|uniref:hypothetical protein n=1 Tax=Deinococcus misasensis TaxID=392413 RepID=UPI0012FCFF03|nr:hypothetical protein [Deinococcus misasensis]
MKKLSRSEMIMVTGFIVVGLASTATAVFVTRELARANRSLDKAEESITTAANSVNRVLQGVKL